VPEHDHFILTGYTSDVRTFAAIVLLLAVFGASTQCVAEDKDELFPAQNAAFRVKALTGGYTRDLATKSNLETGIGANLTGYVIPTAIQPAYGGHPWGVNVYFRVRLKRS
jgi:hypothetical protein